MSAADFQVQWVRYGHRVFDRLARLQAADDRGAVRPCAGRRAGARGGLRFPGRRDAGEARLSRNSIGVVPGWSGTQRAVRRFGAQAVRRMALGGEVLAATEALALGIVDRVVDTGAGASRGDGLGRKDRRARTARHGGRPS